MKINNQIKEIEREIEEIRKKKDYEISFNNTDQLKKELKFLNQFQKEIKELQGELKDGMDITDNLKTFDKGNGIISVEFAKEEIDKIFKKRFGDLK